MATLKGDFLPWSGQAAKNRPGAPERNQEKHGLAEKCLKSEIIIAVVDGNVY